MADSMIERVARALCEQDGADPDEHLKPAIDISKIGDPLAPKPTTPRWHRYRARARAALSAMREPDPAFWRKVTDQGDTAENNARALWQHMIDAALVEYEE